LAGSDWKMAQTQEKETCPQYDLSGKALYLRPYEYWSQPIHTIKNLGISISACTECPTLYNKFLSITPVNHSAPPAKTTQNFSICPYNLQITL
jgi:hypothetical protein